VRLLWILLSWKLNILNVWICIASLIYSLSVGCTCSTGSRALKNIDDYFHSFAISLNSSCCLLKSWISPERHSFRYSFVRFSNTLISNSHYSSKWHPTIICFNCQCVPFCQKKQKITRRVVYSKYSFSCSVYLLRWKETLPHKRKEAGEFLGWQRYDVIFFEFSDFECGRTENIVFFLDAQVPLNKPAFEGIHISLDIG